MVSMRKYLDLKEKHPSLFLNPTGKDVIEIITDPNEIIFHQERIRDEYKTEGKPRSWIDIGVLVDDPWYIVVRDLVRFPDGFVGGYIRFINRKTLEGGTSVVVLPVQSGKIVMISHFRHETRNFHWEMPSGFGEPDLDSRQNALKELSEEIGVVPIKLIEMSVEIESEDSRYAYYFAELDPQQSIRPDISEGIGNYILLTPSEFEEWVKVGKITDSNALKIYLIAIAQNRLNREKVQGNSD